MNLQARRVEPVGAEHFNHCSIEHPATFVNASSPPILPYVAGRTHLPKQQIMRLIACCRRLRRCNGQRNKNISDIFLILGDRVNFPKLNEPTY